MAGEKKRAFTLLHTRPVLLFSSGRPCVLLASGKKADPNAKLIYNDNKVEGAGLPGGRSVKADAMYEMLKGESSPHRFHRVFVCGSRAVVE